MDNIDLSAGKYMLIYINPDDPTSVSKKLNKLYDEGYRYLGMNDKFILLINYPKDDRDFTLLSNQDLS